SSTSTATNMCCQAPATQTSSPANAAVASSTSDATRTHASAPQCCHCGWRGAHSPDCPFK
ncbi:hypothetical protein BD626DRAFT_404727, partial [Schizophyllum amplum]